MKRSFVSANTVPEAFYERACRDPEKDFYFSKQKGLWKGRTYGEALDYTFRSMAGLKRLNFSKGEIVIIFAENCEEWVLTDYAVQWMGGAVAAIYTTNSIDQIDYILKETEAVGIFVAGAKLVQKLNSVAEWHRLKWIVSWNSDEKPQSRNRVQIYEGSDFLRESMPLDEAKQRLGNIGPQDLSILLYTSGTTGEPKGVMLSQENVMSNIKDIMSSIEIYEDRVVLSFLPLSHIYERLVHSVLLFSGTKIYFAESIEKLVENLGDIRPQLMTAVPRIFEKMYSRIQESLKRASFFKKILFRLAFKVSEKTFSRRQVGLSPGFPWNILFFIFDFLVLRKIRAITGGRAELFISGGAPLSQEIAKFFFEAGFTILEGYGLSETGILSVNRKDRLKFGTVGIPFPSVQLRFAADGEILVKGPTVMRGYFKRPQETSEVIDSDGWFQTGDIGEFDSDGFLRITDRKKDLIVLAGGKKIAPQPIENQLKKDPIVESACLIGDQRNYVIALIVPNLDFCRGWAKSKGITIDSLDDCFQLKELAERVQKIVDEVNLSLPRYSTVKYFRLMNQSFSIESGELTPTLKIKRRVIQKKYGQIIDEVYEKNKSADRESL